MKKLLLIHSIVEMAAGVVFILRPDLILMSDGQSIDTLIVAKLYGVLMITFGLVCFMIYKIFLFNDAFKKIILAIMLFHLMVAFQMYAAYNQGATPNLGAFGFHLIFALLFFGIFMKDPNAFSGSKADS